MNLPKLRIVVMFICVLGVTALPGSALHAQEDEPAAALKAQWVADGNALWALPRQPVDGAAQPTIASASAEPDAIPGSVFDWSRLAFDSGRDGNWEIYTARGDGVQPFRVTNHPASDVQPQLNHGATTVVFTSNRAGGQFDIFTADAGGNNVQRITSSSHDDSYPAFSPDGAHIAYARYQENNWEIYRMQANGSGQTRLTWDSNYDDLMPTWSPDGQRITWVRSQNGMGAIWTMNGDGSGMQALTLPYRYLQNPRWSPDGRRVTFDADIDGDFWNELVIFDLTLGYIVGTYDPQQPLLDVWASAWSPDGQNVSFSQVGYAVIGGQLSISASAMGHMRVEGGLVTLLPGSGLDILNDWRTADIQPPASQVAPLPAYSRAAGFAVSWSGADVGLAGLAGFDVQERVGSGGWSDWLRNTSETTAYYVGAPNTAVAFRVRARDQAGNVEAWRAAPNGDAATTLYSWQLTGRVMDSRGIPLAGAAVTIAPAPVAPVRSDIRGSYQTLLLANGAHTLSADLAGYGAALASAFNMTADRAVDISLPPVDDRIQNGGFEVSGQPLAGWQSSGSVRATQPGQWGASAAALGENCLAPCLSQPTPLWPGGELDYPDVAVDSAGNFHAVFSGWDGVLNRAIVLHGMRLRSGEVISPTLVGGAGAYHSYIRPRLTIAADDTLHAIWVGGQGLYYSNRPPGSAWTPFRVLGPGEDPDIAVDSQGRVHIIYRCFGDSCGSSSQIYYRQRLPAGAWQAPVALNSQSGYMLPGITVGPDDAVHLIWQETSGSGRINARTRWVDGSWTPTQTVFAGTSYTSVPQVILADPSGGVHALWNSPYQVYYAYRQPNGAWSTALALPQMERSFRAAVDPLGRIHVLGMLEYAPGAGLYYVVRQPNGAWSAPLRMADDIHELVFGADGVPQLLAHDPSGLGPMLYRTAARLAQPATSTLVQTVTIPSQMHRPTLGFWYRIDGATSNSQTPFVVSVTAGAAATEVYSTTVAPDWQQQAVDLTPWRGQTVTVGLELRQAAGDFYETLLLDTVTLGSWLTPTPASVLPDALPAYTAARLTIRGDNFLPGAGVRVGATTLDGVTWVDSQTLRIDLPSSFGAGMYDLWVVNPGGQASVLPAGLRLGRFIWFPR